ncbi:hypothetical protein [Saccharopolyspora taberi]|uniref:hypothetical protein n=1 Tax=Saccharopolyspora taberi TaxID=60895 RepID=UPI0031D8A06F
MTAGNRVLDVLSGIKHDSDIRIMFTVAPGAAAAGAELFLAEAGALVLPWQQACRRRFDLIVTASASEASNLTGPVLLLLNMSERRIFAKERRAGGIEDLHRAVLGRGTVPAVIGLPHRRQRDLLYECCPEAARYAAVIGDVGYDRLIASLPLRDAYRSALGIRNGHVVILATTTRGPCSVFGTDPAFFSRLTEELLGNGNRVLFQLHPGIWFGHGVRRVRAWIRTAHASGLEVIAPTVDWRIPLIAADRVVGDDEAVITHAAAIGKPVATFRSRPPGCAPGPVAEAVAKVSTTVNPAMPLHRQLDSGPASGGAEIAAQLTSAPGRSGALVRAVVYRLLHLPEPRTRPSCRSIPAAGIAFQTRRSS